mmetsp:Transcript_23617/g.47671  ORF Transcript_23617/g.47671 Transcript_23617/m.47671 type:complete len:293 (-) Transcript_23617:1607-2485(-)
MFGFIQNIKIPFNSRVISSFNLNLKVCKIDYCLKINQSTNPIFFFSKNFDYSKKKGNFSMTNSDQNSLLENEQTDLSGDGGVIKKIQKKGNGEHVKEGDFVKVHYKGQLENGETFDSSLDRKEPYSFKLGEGKVIKGWEIGIKSMEVGEKAQFFISSNYGYKKKGIPPIIPPNAKLFFEIDLLESSGKSEVVDGFFDGKTSNVARTPSAISEDFQERISKKNNKPTGFGNFFFISPFRSQTGGKAPWWLNPNITFVLAAAILLIVFSTVVSIGGVHQGYVDESFDANPLNRF